MGWVKPDVRGPNPHPTPTPTPNPNLNPNPHPRPNPNPKQTWAAVELDVETERGWLHNDTRAVRARAYFSRTTQ